MSKQTISLTGRCHCGAVRFEAIFRDGMGALNRCNCSLCRKKGAVMTSIPLADLKLLSGEDALALYQWNTRVAKHYFCKVCGVYTHHQRRSAPDLYAINVACLDDQTLIGDRPIGTLNGAANSVVSDERT